MFVSPHVCVCVLICVCMCKCEWVYQCEWVWISVYVWECVRVWVYKCVWVRTHVCVNVTAVAIFLQFCCAIFYNSRQIFFSRIEAKNVSLSVHNVTASKKRRSKVKSDLEKKTLKENSNRIEAVNSFQTLQRKVY